MKYLLRSKWTAKAFLGCYHLLLLLLCNLALSSVNISLSFYFTLLSAEEDRCNTQGPHRLPEGNCDNLSEDFNCRPQPRHFPKDCPLQQVSAQVGRLQNSWGKTYFQAIPSGGCGNVYRKCIPYWNELCYKQGYAERLWCGGTLCFRSYLL